MTPAQKKNMPWLVAVLLLAAAGTAARGQTALFSNGSAAASTPALNARSTTVSGQPAQAGTQWSEVASNGAFVANAMAGYACHAGVAETGYTLADDFTVPSGLPWRIDTLRVFAYQPGWNGPGSPIGSAFVRVWTAKPGTPGAQVITGSLTANRLSATSPTGIYRVFTTQVGPLITSTDITRAIFAADVNVNVTLSPGTYWIEWMLAPSQSGSRLFSPSATPLAGLAPPASNAIQSLNATWFSLLDPGKPMGAAGLAMDLPFQLFGGLGNACDSIDFNGDGIEQDPTDLEAFLSVYSGGPCVPPLSTCNDIDFNNDGIENDPTDIEAFISVYSGGPCI